MTDRLSQFSLLIVPTGHGWARSGQVRIISRIINLVVIIQIVAVVVQLTSLAVGPA